MTGADLQVSLPGTGTVTVDIAYGGAFYAILPASELGLSLHDKTHYEKLVKAGTAVTGQCCIVRTYISLYCGWNIQHYDACCSCSEAVYTLVSP